MQTTGIALMLTALIGTIATLSLPLGYRATERSFTGIAGMIVIGGLLLLGGYLI